MKKVTYILIGIVISAAILLPSFKKRRAEGEAQEKELSKKMDDVMKEAMDEEQRHFMAMEAIEKRGEQERKELKEKTEKEIRELFARTSKIAQDYNVRNADEPIHCMMKYRDANREIHEFDAADPEQFNEVMKVRTNQLIFE